MNRSTLPTPERPSAGRCARLLLAGVAAFVSACSSPRVHTDFDPQADFSAYRTFGFVETLGTDTGEYGTLLSKHLRAAAKRELEARGYSVSENPDLLVNFHLQTRDRVRTMRTYSTYYRYRRECRWPYGVWGGYPRETFVDQYTEETLHIDLVDRARRQVVWEAAVVGRVDSNHPESSRERANAVVVEAFEHYPPERDD